MYVDLITLFISKLTNMRNIQFWLITDCVTFVKANQNIYTSNVEVLIFW